MLNQTKPNQTKPNQTKTLKSLESLEELTSSNPDVEVLWLYGSRARGQASTNSDYDLAVAFTDYGKMGIRLLLSWKHYA